MGFLGSLFAAKNNFQAGNMDLSQTNFLPSLQGSLGQPQNTINQQQSLANALQQQMQGGGPNLAETQLQAGTDRAIKQAAALGGAQRGLSPGTAARQILQQQAGINQGSANEAAQLRQQQQLQAQGQLGNVLAQQGQLGLGQVGALGNLQQAQNALNLQQSLGTQGLNLQAQQANQQAANNFLPGILGGVGQAAKGIAELHDGGVAHDFRDGGQVPGEAEHAGDHPDNDTVPAMLSPGEVVVPRTLVKQAALDPDKVASFVSAFTGQPQSSGYGKVLQAKRKVAGFHKGGKV
jgi:hypothetical protein